MAAKLLIIEDNAPNRELMGYLLRAAALYHAKRDEVCAP
jgi:hypothetical protein